MEKVFLETSVFIRYFTADDKKKFKDCSELLKIIERGKVRPYTSNIVLFEILFVLTRIYKFSKKEVLEEIEKILDIRNLTLIDTTNSKEAIRLFKKYNVKYPDCLIATQVPKKTNLVTYDEEFNKIPTLSPVIPKDLV